jgi:hypothetical protein
MDEGAPLNDARIDSLSLYALKMGFSGLVIRGNVLILSPRFFYSQVAPRVLREDVVAEGTTQ